MFKDCCDLTELLLWCFENYWIRSFSHVSLYHFKDWQPEDAVNLMYTKLFNTYPFPIACTIPKYHSIPWPCKMFHNILRFYDEELLAPCPTPKLDDYPLSGWSSSYPPYWKPFLRPQPEDTPCRGDMDPLIMDQCSTLLVTVNVVHWLTADPRHFLSFFSSLFWLLSTHSL